MQKLVTHILPASPSRCSLSFGSPVRRRGAPHMCCRRCSTDRYVNAFHFSCRNKLGTLRRVSVQLESHQLQRRRSRPPYVHSMSSHRLVCAVNCLEVKSVRKIDFRPRRAKPKRKKCNEKCLVDFMRRTLLGSMKSKLGRMGRKRSRNPDALCFVCRRAFAFRERHQMQRITVNIILLDEFPFAASSPAIRLGARDPYLICNRAYDFQFTLLNRAERRSSCSGKRVEHVCASALLVHVTTTSIDIAMAELNTLHEIPLLFPTTEF